MKVAIIGANGQLGSDLVKVFKGTYTIPAAKIAGKEGIVYALDKDKKALDELMQKAESAGLENIKRIDASGDLKIPLTDESVDIVLLYDVFHSYYFSQMADRRKILEEVYRVSKRDAIISVWPKPFGIRDKRRDRKCEFLC